MRRREFVKAMLAASVSARTMMGQQAPASVAPSVPPPIPPHAAPPPAPGPLPWMRGLLEAKPLPMMPLVPDAVAHTKTYFFTQQQLATLRQLCEVLMPPLKNAPGALDAGAPEFLDFLISVSPADRQRRGRLRATGAPPDSWRRRGRCGWVVRAPWRKTTLDGTKSEPRRREEPM